MAIDMNALRAKALKKNEEDRKIFLPLDLNEGNVQAIFNRCLATKDDDRDKLYGSELFQRDLGYDEDSKPVYFSKGRLEQNRKNILYLLGQLKTVHENDLKIAYDTSNKLSKLNSARMKMKMMKKNNNNSINRRESEVIKINIPYKRLNRVNSASQIVCKPTTEYLFNKIKSIFI